MPSKTSPVSPCVSTTLTPLLVSPSQVIKGEGVLFQARNVIADFGQRPLVVGGQQTLKVISPHFDPIFSKCRLKSAYAIYTPDCSESSLDALKTTLKEHQGDVIIGVGGGKALDIAKLLAHQRQLPIITVPTSAATCAAWTALSNLYSNEGAFQHDVSLSRCPDLLILDYAIIKTASERTLVAGIGDAIAKWYEASVSSGDSTTTLTIAAVQQARVLRDLLFQKSVAALKTPGGEVWREVVDACVLLAGVIGGLGGANCRTVAAHAVHNGLTHIRAAHSILHGEKVAYGILVQLRLEEMIQSNQLAVSSRQQLLKFYEEIGLPKTLEELGLSNVTLGELRRAADVTCCPESDIHRLPFVVSSEQLLAAMVSTTSDFVSDRIFSNV
ncbi:glycerol dehydrogenase [cyanobacterium endosymbiont of Rhopalodia gibberula]|uniref:iron-containing alcohol dehydrogenase family protein n=1 Tax=cyanobacterium endosymbiont of Rhopalodia gibberula TaxID=1763363 RepID=UPI000DC7343D|nr:iron-containing alcohol dehydrogenase family protein [cyanobacterium endosymbiont of Rhopalodia gibberula]BBA79130.1 glycerol dehydrogenase [cyanobacterium endosymbiont of Rhopalodia gibberula]